jgi:hypothetical protein
MDNLYEILDFFLNWHAGGEVRVYIDGKFRDRESFCADFPARIACQLQEECKNAVCMTQRNLTSTYGGTIRLDVTTKPMGRLDRKYKEHATPMDFQILRDNPELAREAAAVSAGRYVREHGACGTDNRLAEIRSIAKARIREWTEQAGMI